MTDVEVIAKAADAFKRRDAALRELQEIDAEIKGLVRSYSIAMKLWGFTPVMLRHAVEARLGKVA